MHKIVQRDKGHHLLYWLESSPEEIHVELLELGTGQRLGEVLSLEERLHVDPGGVRVGEGPLGLLNFPPQLLGGPVVLPEILAVLLLENLVISETI